MPLNLNEQFSNDFLRKPTITKKSKEAINPYSSFEEMLESTREIVVDPIDFIGQAIRTGTQVISLGEKHDIKSIELSELLIIQQLIEEFSLENIALEILKKYQNDISSYLKSGNIDQLLKKVPIVRYKKDLRKVIEVAQKNGVQIHCIDDTRSSIVQSLVPFLTQSVRDRRIHKNIFSLVQNEASPVLAILGSSHSSHTDDATLHFIQDFKYPKLNDFLKEKYLPLAYCELTLKQMQKANLTLPKTGSLVPTGIDKRFDVTHLSSISDYCGNYAGVIFVEGNERALT